MDDSRVMRSMVKNTLSEAEIAEFEYEEAGSGTEALDKFDADVTDIIFVDWNMPEMNGIEFARMIRSMSWASHIPIVMITSESGDEKQKNAFEKARITCYITKPFTTEEIKEKVAPVIEKIQEKQSGASKTVPPSQNQTPKASGGFF